MIGLIYILLCFTVGWAICTYAFPGLKSITQYDYYKRKIYVSPYLLMLPAWYITGTLAVTWSTYLVAYQFGNASKPLFYANIIVMPIAFFLSLFAFFIKYHNNKISRPVIFCNNKNTVRNELILLAAIALLACVLMLTTFFVYNNKLYVGVSVFSDFSLHVGMIRSFSFGNNFPTAFSHYAGEDIKYHFMFEFLTGNLEYLGLRIDYAFNISSIISFISAFLLLYLMAVKITGKIGAGTLACLFFAFRSSKTLFTYIANLPVDTNIWKALAENTDFISDTPNENWGLWNLNVYCNQRHLAFGLATIFFVLIMFLPHLFEMFEVLNKQIKNPKDKWINRLSDKLRIIFFTRDGWEVLDYRRAIATGIILGSLAFFHGAAEICCLTILFLMAIVSKRRLEHLITALITLVLSTLQTHLFIQGSVVSTKFLFGFIAENKTLFGVASYLDRLLGILPFVILAAFCLEKGVGRYLILAFSAPLVFAFTISLTADVTVNHKYIMMSCILIGIFAASILVKLFERKDFFLKLIGVFLIIALTSTGIYDFITVLNKNTPNTAMVLNLEDPLTKWINDNSDSKDIFLTSNYALNQVVLGGAMLYEGWPYFPWSAGYDTDYRTEQVKLMYEAQTPTQLDALVKKNNIRFIIVDHDNRTSDSYIVNEDNIKTTYQCKYSVGDGEWMTSIYDTQKPLN
ncbi:MAG: hypothetical protein PHF63_08300 [Herbinix sp.]|nr:hypothetical protein [Herbinix sp.]